MIVTYLDSDGLKMSSIPSFALKFPNEVLCGTWRGIGRIPVLLCHRNGPLSNNCYPQLEHEHSKQNVTPATSQLCV